MKRTNNKFDPRMIERYRMRADKTASTNLKQIGMLQAQMGKAVDRIANDYQALFDKGAASAIRYEAVTWMHLGLDYFHRIQGTSVGLHINKSELLITACGIVEGQMNRAFEPWYRWNVHTYIVNPETAKVRGAIVLSNADKRKIINVSRAYSKFFGSGPTAHKFQGSMLILEKALSADERDWVERVKVNPEAKMAIGQSDLLETPPFEVIDESSPMPPLPVVEEALKEIQDDFGDEFD